eukprot:m.242728 g.242728  ORF g.242728 m.242728 type:complete len:3263 (+) comp17138_c0_seq1:1001-10789(+)
MAKAMDKACHSLRNWLCLAAIIASTVAAVDGSESTTQRPAPLAFSDFFTRVSRNEFFESIYQQDTLIDRRPNQTLPSRLLEVVHHLNNIDELCEHFEQDTKLLRGFQIKEQGQTRKVATCQQLYAELHGGAGAVVRFEDLLDSPAKPHVQELHSAVKDVFGTESTVHLYHARKNDSRALMPHTDPYDVLVVQVEGSKRWTACVPDAYIQQATTTDTDGRPLTPKDDPSSVVQTYNTAQLAQLQEIRRQRQQGCTYYDDRDLAGMRCQNFTLRRGDTMYMPKGIIHFALSGPEGSSHLTIALERKGLAWADALLYGAQVSEVQDEDFAAHWIEAVKAIIGQDLGVPFLEAMPSWTLNTPDGVCETDEAALEAQHQFLHEYQAMCQQTLPHVLEAYQAKDTLAVFLDATSIQSMVDQVCSSQTAEKIREKLCVAGALPFDVTSPKTFKQFERQRRSSVFTSYTCDSSCDDSCDSFSCSCDSSCTTVCNSGCTSCDSSCNSQVCTGSCDSSCDIQTCTSSCDSSCDGLTCDSSCDTCTSCDGCDSGCDSSCDSGCNWFGWSCDSGCDSSCDSSCDWSCDYCYASCDSSCQYDYSCDSSCDSGCVYDQGCDSSCDSSCTPTSCDSSCDGPCNSGCVTTCDSGCDSCPVLSTCDSSCDGSCQCNPGYYGSGSSCRACPTHTYASQSGSSKCTSCPGCSSGQYRINCGGSNVGSCTGCPSCPAGQERLSCQGTSPGSCHSCKSGYYKTRQDASACLRCASCPAGYTRVGCGGSNPGSCVGRQCSTPPSVSHATVRTSNNGAYPSTATYTCQAGYQLADSKANKLTCTTDGSWSGTTPRCIGVPCPTLSLNHGAISPSGLVRYPTTASFSCDTGYVVQGSSSATCRADGTWSTSAPTCIGRICSTLQSPSNGQVTYTNNRHYPSDAVYSCNVGYERASGDTRRSCIGSTGTYSGTAMECRGKQCNALTAPTNGNVRFSNSERRYPVTAEITCDPGYELTSKGTLSCKTDLTWTPTKPSCRGIICPAPTIGNADVSLSSSRYPSTATVKCKPGYGIMGVASLSCSVTGEWGTLPTCTKCPADMYPSPDDQTCIECPAGTTTNGVTGATKCECFAGFELSTDGDGSCAPCQENYYKPNYGNGACSPCSKGYETVNFDYTQCVGVTCDAIPTVKYGMASATDTLHYPESISYSCEVGFSLSGQKDLSCGTDGAWSPQAPTCDPICGDGIIVEGEECDDGNNNGSDGCTDCMLDGTHECPNPGETCQRCRVEVLPEDLTLSCDTPDLDTRLSSWIQYAGHETSVPLSSQEQCVVTGVTNDVAQHSGSTYCYSSVYQFVASFNGGQASDTLTGRVHIEDTSAPTFSSIPEGSVFATCGTIPPFVMLDASDNCEPTPSVTRSEMRQDGHCKHSYQLQRTWTATDTCGNTKTVTQTVFVEDNEIPALASEPQVTELECTATLSQDIESLRLNHAGVMATDACTESLTYSTIVANERYDRCNGTIDLLVTVRDECNNTLLAQSVAKVTDTLPPVPTNVPKDVAVSCAAVPPMPDDVTAQDACMKEVVSATTSEQRIDGNCPYTYQLNRTFTFVDACGWPTSRSQLITVSDTTGPEILREPDPLVLECQATTTERDINAWLARNGGAQAKDDCSGTRLTWTNNFDQVRDDTLQGCSGTGTVEVTFTVTDECQRSTQVTSRIAIKDTRPPVFVSTPADETVRCDAIPEPPSLVAADNCTAAPTVSHTQQHVDGACTSEYGIIHTWTAKDDCGLTYSYEQTITVVDGTPPVIDLPAQDTTIECVAESNEEHFAEFLSTNGGAEARDACSTSFWLYSDASQELDVTKRDAFGKVTKHKGCGNTFSASVLFYAIDDCNNAATTNATFVVQDTTPPVFLPPPPSELTAECDAVPALTNLTVHDACDGELVAIASERRLPGRCTQTYTLARTWTATDACGLPSSVSQLVSVTDSMGPEITVPAADLILECDNTTMDAIHAWLDASGHAEASDTCDSALTWTHNFEAVRHSLQFGCGQNSVAVTFTVKDECGNSAHTEGHIVVHDTTPPAFLQFPSDQVSECQLDTNNETLAKFLASNGGSIVHDLCSSSQQLVWAHETTSKQTCGNAYDTIVRFTVTDACGNSANASATLGLRDTQPPVIQLKGSNPQVSQVEFPWIDPSILVAADKCHADVTAFVNVSNLPNVTHVGTYNVTYSVKDACGLVGETHRIVRILDRLPPSVTVNGPRVLFMYAGAEYFDAGATVSDNYAVHPALETIIWADGQQSRLVQEAAYAANRTVFHVLYRATDPSGNSVLHLARTVHVLQPPEHTTPETASVTFNFNPSINLLSPRAQAVGQNPDALASSNELRYTVTRIVLTTKVTRATFAANKLEDTFGGTIYDYVIEDQNVLQSEVHAILGEVTQDTVAVARRSASVEAMSDPVGVVAFYGSVRSDGDVCEGPDSVEHALGRNGRQLLWAECEGCLCIYAARQPSSHGQFDIPRLEQAMQQLVTLETQQQNAQFDLDVLERKLLQLGIIPINLQFVAESDRKQASFVTRSPLPKHPNGFLPAKARLVSSEIVVSTQLVFDIRPDTTNMTVLTQLYRMGIIPEHITYTEITTPVEEMTTPTVTTSIRMSTAGTIVGSTSGTMSTMASMGSFNISTSAGLSTSASLNTTGMATTSGVNQNATTAIPTTEATEAKAMSTAVNSTVNPETFNTTVNPGTFNTTVNPETYNTTTMDQMPKVEVVRVILDTHNDVTARALASFVQTAWLQSNVTVTYIPPEVLAEPAWPFNYTVTFTPSAPPDILGSVIVPALSAFGLQVDQHYKLSAQQGSTCTLFAVDRLSHQAIQALRTSPSISDVSLTQDGSIEAEILGSLEARLESLLPYPADLISVVQTSGSSRRGSAVEATAIFTAPPAPRLLTTGPSSDYVIPRDRYLLRFRVTTLSTAREDALVALSANTIPAVQVTAQGTEISAIITTKVGDEHLAALASHAHVVPSSVEELVTMDAAMSLEDAVETTLLFVGHGQVNAEVHGRILPVVEAETLFAHTTTTTAPNMNPSSNAPPTTNPNGNAESSASKTSGSVWQISVGAIGGVIVIVALVLAFLYRSRRAKGSGQATNQRPQIAFENPIYANHQEYEGTNDASLQEGLYEDVAFSASRKQDLSQSTSDENRIIHNPIYDADQNPSDPSYMDISHQGDGDGDYTEAPRTHAEYMEVSTNGHTALPSSYDGDYHDVAPREPDYMDSDAAFGRFNEDAQSEGGFSGFGDDTEDNNGYLDISDGDE